MKRNRNKINIIFLATYFLVSHAKAADLTLDQKIKIREATAQSTSEQLKYLDTQIAEINKDIPTVGAAVSIPLDLAGLALYAVTKGPYSGSGIAAAFGNFAARVVNYGIARPLVVVTTGIASFKVTRIIQGKLAIKEINGIRDLAELRLLHQQKELSDLHTANFKDKYSQCIEAKIAAQECLSDYTTNINQLKKNLDADKISKEIAALESKTRSDFGISTQAPAVNAIGDYVGVQ